MKFCYSGHGDNIWKPETHTYIMGIQIPNIQITETFEYPNFTCLLTKWFGIKITIWLPNLITSLDYFIFKQKLCFYNKQ